MKVMTDKEILAWAKKYLAKRRAWQKLYRAMPHRKAYIKAYKKAHRKLRKKPVDDGIQGIGEEDK